MIFKPNKDTLLNKYFRQYTVAALGGVKHEHGRYLTRFPYCILCIHCCESRVQFFTVFAGAAGVPFPMISLFAFNQHCEPAIPRSPLPSATRASPPNPTVPHYHLKRILFGFVFGCCLLLSYEDF